MTQVLEALALALHAHADDFVDHKPDRRSLEEIGDLIPQETWDSLLDQGLLRIGRDSTDEMFSHVTRKGHDRLVEHMRTIVLGEHGVHVLEIRASREWSLLHPLSCRPDLLDCEVHQHVTSVELGEYAEGRYKAFLDFPEALEGGYVLALDAL